MSELPPPDVLDQGGRLRRIVLALIVAAPVAAITYVICTSLAEPDQLTGAGSSVRGWRFVFYMTAFFGAGAFAITLAVANWLAKRKDERERVPRAEVR